MRRGGRRGGDRGGERGGDRGGRRGDRRGGNPVDKKQKLDQELNQYWEKGGFKEHGKFSIETNNL